MQLTHHYQQETSPNYPLEEYIRNYTSCEE